MSRGRIAWPEGKRCALMVSVNLDAEFYGRIFYPDMDVDEGDVLRLGKSGMLYGLPRLLDTLDHDQVKATFFVPGEVAARYPDKVKEIGAKGHEIGCHGDRHEVLGSLSKGEQRSVLENALKKLRAVTDKPIRGFRMPEGEVNEDTFAVVKELGFCYSSSLSDDDVPYRHERTGLLELPIHWELFDLPYFTFAFDPPIPPGQSRSASMDQVLKNWEYEWQGARKWGTLMNLQLDPQTIGEQGRIFMLERLLEQVQEKNDTWIATGEMIADYVSEGGRT